MQYNKSFDYRTFTNQFIFCKKEQYIPSVWCRRELGEWLLGFHTSLPVIPIQGPQSLCLGWLLGYPIDEDSSIPKSEAVCDQFTEENLTAFENWLYRLGGAFVAIIITRQASRIYLDANGMLPIVYHPESETVASTPTLIGAVEFDTALIKMVGIPERDGWYPFGLTPKKGVERLVPNHYLDLVTWDSYRHWPSESIAINQDTASTTQEIASVIKRTIEAVTKEYSTYMSLTAGGDTRVMLACARNQLDDINFYTTKFPGENGNLDFKVACEIARRFNLKHKALQAKQVTKQQQEEWLCRTGYCAAGRVLTYSASDYQLNPQCPLLIGKPGQVGEAVFYRHFGATPDTKLSGEEIARFLRMPEMQEIVSRADAWLQELSDYDILTVFDLLHLEQRHGCWGAPQRYGNNWNAFQLYPLSHRRIYELALSLPYGYRMETRLRSDIINLQWPELLELPINNYTGLRRFKKTIRQTIGKIKLAREIRNFALRSRT
jgi:hypothetical protein